MGEYEGHRVTVDPVIEYDGQIALVKRKYDPYQGDWALPGGHVDPGETPREAVVREAYEETGLDVELEDEIGEFSDEIQDPRGPVIQIAYACSTDDPALDPATDADDAAWFELDELPDDLAFGHEAVLEEYLVQG
ncbi:MAG: NUDIX hydrolase [Candidatus Nanohaloarchaea archaeon]|nr:NUDIX hydrolase [Candidatus Nanohaloarchaea archaeon]